jgi:hypothetical protein
MKVYGGGFLRQSDCTSLSKGVSASAVPTRLALFGPPPLLEGEDSAAYDELLALVSGSMEPADVLDEIWVRDLVDLIWETFRWRRLKTRLIAATTYKGIEAVLEPMNGSVCASHARCCATRISSCSTKQPAQSILKASTPWSIVCWKPYPVQRLS